MSELYDDPADAPSSPNTRVRALVLSAVVLVLLIIGVTRFAAFYTDKLWYDSVHAGHVFTTLFWTKVLLFLAFGVVMGVSIGASMLVAFRSRPFFRAGDEHSSLARYRDAVTPIRTWLFVGVSVIAGIFAGISGAGQWRRFLLWRHGGTFGQQDSYFHKDIGFYVFDLPWWHYLVDFVLAASALALVFGLIVHYLYGGIRLGGSGGERLSGAAQVQLSVLLGIFVLVKAVDYWLDRYDLVHSSGPSFTGIGFTDDHAVLPAKNILAGIALICAVLFFLNMWRRTWQLPSVGLALLVLSAVLLGLIWPAIVQGFQVKPSEADKERPYVAANIAATRTAYGIDDQHVKVEDYSDNAKAAGASPTALDNAASALPVVDPSAVQRQFEQTQQEKSYYQVTDPLDVDHYDIDGKDRALVLGVREVNEAGISSGDKNWTNLHTVYTHSDGVIAAFANQRDLTDATESPELQWAQNATTDDLTRGEIEDRIYYGEHSPDYSVVGRPTGAKPVELDLGGHGSGSTTTTTYDGSGGVSISSTFRRLLYAVKFGSANFLLSERVNDDSKVLYNRSPKEAVAKVAPWLTLDNDPYPVVVDGRILWVVDGYTTTDQYPESERDSYSAMTDEALPQNTGLPVAPTDQINYMRNSVKATVDAYNGTVTLYEWQPDPILKAWESAFPGVVKPKSAIPADLLSHLRYPEDLYKVQRYQLARYHVTSAVDFLQGSDRWAVPEDPVNNGHLQTPVRMFMDADPTTGETGQVWSLTSTFVPNNRNNLAAVMAVDSDPESADYGTIRILRGFGESTAGPGQIANLFQTNSVISGAVADFSHSSGLISWGNILTVPTAQHGLLYVEPVYASQAGASSSSYAVLAFVLVSYDGQLGYGHTLQEAIADALTGGGESTSTTPPPTPPTSPSTSPSTSGKPSKSPSSPSTQPSTAMPSDVGTLLDDAKQLFAEADQAGKDGNYARRERLLAQAEAKVKAAAALLSPSPTP